MEKLNIIKVFNYFLKKIWLILLISVIVFLIGFIYYKKTKIGVYKSDVNILIVTTDEYSLQTNNSVMLTYSEIVKSRKVLDSVINELDMDMSYNTLFNKISASFTADSKILTIEVKDKSSSNAKDIANIVAKFFCKEAKKRFDDHTITIIDDAVESDIIIDTLEKRDLLNLVVVGIILGLSLVFIIYYFDNTIKDIENIELNFNIPIFGKIRKSKKFFKDDINILKTNIKYNLTNKKTILITSSKNKEGKIKIGMELAKSFLNDNEKVLFINLNNLYKNLDIFNIKNLDYIVRDDINIDDNAIKLELEKYEKKYDRIIIVGMPIINSSTLILSKLVDSTFIVSKLDYTKISELNDSIRNLNLIKSNITGIIIDNVY